MIYKLGHSCIRYTSFVYSSQVPPARIGTEAAPVSINVGILFMQPVDILNLKLHLTLTITLVWKDPRVNMESLNYDDKLNKIVDSVEVYIIRAFVFFTNS